MHNPYGPQNREGRLWIVSALRAVGEEWPVSVSIDGWTTYTMDQIIACKGPGE